jgi:hypothetical protein
LSEKKKKIEGKNKRTPCMPVVKNLGLVFIQEHTLKQNRGKKKGPILGTFEFPV